MQRHGLRLCERRSGGNWARCRRGDLQAALRAEFIGRNFIQALFCWWPPYLRWALRARNAKSGSDFDDLPFIVEESGDAHGPPAAGTLKRANLKDAFYAGSPAYGRFCSLLLRS